MAVLCCGFGGPEQGVYAAVYGFLGRFREGDGVDGGVEGGSGVRIAKGTAWPVRVFEPLLAAEDLENDTPGGMQTPRWEPSGQWKPGDQRLPFGSRLSSRWWFTFISFR